MIEYPYVKYPIYSDISKGKGVVLGLDIAKATLKALQFITLLIIGNRPHSNQFSIHPLVLLSGSIPSAMATVIIRAWSAIILYAVSTSCPNTGARRPRYSPTMLF